MSNIFNTGKPTNDFRDMLQTCSNTKSQILVLIKTPAIILSIKLIKHEHKLNYLTSDDELIAT